jgi:hypothetical protein
MKIWSNSAKLSARTRLWIENPTAFQKNSRCSVCRTMAALVLAGLIPVGSNSTRAADSDSRIQAPIVVYSSAHNFESKGRPSTLTPAERFVPEVASTGKMRFSENVQPIEVSACAGIKFAPGNENVGPENGSCSLWLPSCVAGLLFALGALAAAQPQRISAWSGLTLNRKLANPPGGRS